MYSSREGTFPYVLHTWTPRVQSGFFETQIWVFSGLLNRP
ncbi:hypothetical protein SLEP1_g5796 [Rubroshorea leprosula]|uniref:Uncharacterized protein n=1 Tax=Rubroshorea leprosula TaxID=152421 RepID=A0AAV5I1Y0_9ROSI|nr:hypothetical protein SLEP1_g5796 [Rubroshorea leprosula]